MTPEMTFPWDSNLNQHYGYALQCLLQKYDIQSFVEIGVLDGGLSDSLLGFRDMESYWGVDPFADYDGNRRAECVGAPIQVQRGTTNYMNKWFARRKRNSEKVYAKYPNANLLVMFSADAVKTVGDTDMVFIDGNHGYEHVTADIAAWVPKCRKIVSGHDYTTRWPDVVRAVNEHCTKHNIVLRVAPGNVWYYEK